MTQAPCSKLTLSGNRTSVPAAEAIALLSAIFRALGTSEQCAQQIAEHLTDTSLCGMESHGIMRTLQYAEQMRNGYMTADAEPEIIRRNNGAIEVTGNNGPGIPAMHLAYDCVATEARERGIAALAVRHVGHTGRHGAFADTAAEEGFLTICIGGGNRRNWPQVAPHGGAKGMLPTNPWCVGIPGGDRGPVVLDFATSKIAGGWIYAARSAGALLPEGCVIDRHGNPTRDPEDYFDGGAILPSGAHKGYALALVAEIIGEALLGPSTTECNWLVIALACNHFREASALQAAAEEVLAELRDCPPAPGFAQVEIPGERERSHRAASGGIAHVPEETWSQILALADELGVR